ncbi:hypothetical protein KIH87_02230 [Paraneptunicella aestuarii]|uniref:hypothetical protein n=1 Tax=Paraneptunicella aestuarii TaxID=2831148 RepID=UPI001E439D90|nr:hypothetical protein [Paraneptunicella aestuarii]UAA39202.1 hypothetical protein KIH87_02230 [Paraneptunicella aestuarii]
MKNNCPYCGGSGMKNRSEPCPACNGSGRESSRDVCPHCHADLAIGEPHEKGCPFAHTSRGHKSKGNKKELKW